MALGEGGYNEGKGICFYIQSAKTRLGADCGSDHELFIAKFKKIELKKVGKTLYDLYSRSDK